MVGTIDRRVLVSYRIDPEVVARMLPEPFRPIVWNDVAVGGICLIRLTELRPQPLPRWLGVTTENVAHRFAVEWDGPGGVETGVFVPRRDTSARLAVLVGGRGFPGTMEHGRFCVREDGERVDIGYESDDAFVAIDVRAAVADELPSDSLFGTLERASEFFRRDSRGYSPSSQGGQCECVELCTETWNVTPLAVDSVRSSWFDDEARFPAGSIALDSALLMRRIPAVWRPRPLEASRRRSSMASAASGRKR